LFTYFIILSNYQLNYFRTKILDIFNGLTYLIYFIILVTREVFERKRKEHHNEFQTAKIMAKQIMEDEDENDDSN